MEVIIMAMRTVDPKDLMKELFPEHSKKAVVSEKNSGERPNPKFGEVYKHFKGKLYRIVGIARDCTNDDTKQVVVYKSLDGKRLCTREIHEFMSPVDKQKYPDCKQRWRFQKQSDKSFQKSNNRFKKPA